MVDSIEIVAESAVLTAELVLAREQERAALD
jgi:hypothetical protein